MLKQAKIKLKSLIYDDSGVAMAYTIMVFLFFFMLCVSTYAMSENIRQRMELQNACDAAAYSGAVVQADMLSRIAVLNRALSWTYMQTNRRQMDYLVGIWAANTKSQHNDHVDFVDRNRRTCDCGLHGVQGVNYYVSYTTPGQNRIHMRNHTELAADVRERIDRDTLLRDINIGFTNVTNMQAAVNNIKRNIHNYINQACSTTFNETLGNQRDEITMRVINPNSPATYFVDTADEDTFLAFSNHIAANMRAGVNAWWNLVGGAEIQRTYNNGLVAHYTTHYERWVHINPVFGPSYCSLVFTHLEGRDYRLRMNYSSPAVVGTQLNTNFWGKDGSIVVAAKRQMKNPISLFVESSDEAGMQDGLYGSFNHFNNDMWVVSASRAGIRLTGDAAGHYRVHCPQINDVRDRGYTANVWNLCEEDWDAVMLPVARAWHDASRGAWTGNPEANTLIDGTTLPSGERVPGVREILNVNTPYVNGMGTHIKH